MYIKGLNNPTTMQHNFASQPMVERSRSVFNRSGRHLTAFDSAYLIPIYTDEALPGDTFQMSLAAISRLATPLTPFMDNLYVDFHFFAVPNRLIWDNWQKFCGEQTDPGDSIDYTVPQVTYPGGGHAEESLFDYFGIRPSVNTTINALHSRAYNLIYNEFFRDENLQDSVVVDTDDGPDTDTDYVLLKRGKRGDYFTTMLPWPQKGDAVELPLGTSAPVIGNGKALGLMNDTDYYGLGYTSAQGLTAGTAYYNQVYGTNVTPGTQPPTNDAIGVSDTAGSSGLIADLTAATAATLNDFREAVLMQRMLELDARGGTRYTEILQSHWGVVSPDQRLQRPEFLGGGTRRINVTPIPQTSEAGTTAQGTLAAVGYNEAVGISWTKSFVEHCTLIGLASVRADLTYQQGTHRMWYRQTRYDYAWPGLCHLGEQAVLNQEWFTQGSAADTNTAGYQERYAEYRYGKNIITGKMRSDHASSLDKWHLSQDFSALPVLNADFIVEAPPISRVVAVPSEPEIIMDAYFDLKCTRVMPTFGIPGLNAHM